MDSDTEAADFGVGDFEVGASKTLNHGVGPSGVEDSETVVPEVKIPVESDLPTPDADREYFSEEEVVLEGELSNDEVEARPYPR